MSKHKTLMVAIALSAILLTLIGAYAAYELKLNVNETSNITTNWSVKITNVETKTLSGSAKNKTNPTFDSLTATFDIDFTKVNDYVEYLVTITNEGDLDAKLNSLVINNGGNTVSVDCKEYMNENEDVEGKVIKAKEPKTFIVKISYLGGLSSGSANLTFDYIQA